MALIKTVRTSVVSATLLACACLSVSAQTYPERPIRLVQGFAPGGNADTIERLLGAEMSKSLGQAFFVEAVSGAGGNIAAAAVARAKPYRQLSQLLTDTRAKPQAISYGSAGIGSTHHLVGELLAKMSKADL
jgi:tripartite-type tricarboxylate transporter receptor subunit TctC